MGKILGIDQGITSVGWGIIDTDSNTIVDAGVRLFPEADKTNNEGRRNFRSSRRVKRRRVTRKEDLSKFLKENHLFKEIKNELNPYECRKKGLTEKLSLEELNCAVFHICKHRGSSLDVVSEEKESKDEQSTKYNLAKNDELIKSGKYVCEIQLDRLVNGEKIRGLNNNFRTSDYRKELEKILETQQIPEDISNKIINIVTRRRHFNDGPGSFKSQTPYGKIYDKDGKVKVGMIEKMTGHCFLFPDELRAPKMAPSAELFNLLNDLNNLRIDDEKLDINTKKSIVYAALANGGITPKKIAGLIDTDLMNIEGFRSNKNQEPLITEMPGYRIFKKLFEEHGCEINIKNFDLMDKIAVILTKTKIIDERRNDLRVLLDNEGLIDALAMQTKFTAYHSLSLKAIKILNDELMETQMNQMQIMSLSNKFEFNKTSGLQKGRLKIAINENAVLSPVALRSYKQAVKVINAARKKYGEFDSIVIETTRDKNSADAKKRINETQKYYENRNKIVSERLEAYPNIKINGKLREKILLYEEQEGKTGYGQEPINLHLLITDPNAYEVDHIIPISISLDDSINNKTLTTRKENQEKGNLSPIMAFNAHRFTNGSIEQYKAYVRLLYSNHKISRKKYENYLYEKNINKYENMKDFIARNLVDTSYANRLLLNTLQDYFRDNNIGTTVHTVKGFATNRFRKLLDIEKDRDKDYSHHAIDAILVASIKKMSLYRNLFNKIDITYDGIKFNNQTGEIVDNITDDLVNQEDMIFIKKIKDYTVTRFSHMIDTKPNRSVSDQTIYSTRNYGEGDIVIRKYKDIYDKKHFALANDIINNEAEKKYLIGRNDPQTMAVLKDVVNHYYELHKGDQKLVSHKNGKIDIKFNPFYEYHEETGEYIRKFSKHGDGPIVKSVKFTDGKLGSHIDISKNYKTKNKKVVLQQISAYRTDFYQEPNGIFKFVTIRYSDVRYNNEKEKNCIDKEVYQKKKIGKGISNEAQYQFSMHHNELIEITKKAEKPEMYLFIGTNNDSTNVIECKMINQKSDKRITMTIGKSIEKIRKMSADTLGTITEIKDSVLKLEFL